MSVAAEVENLKFHFNVRFKNFITYFLRPDANLMLLRRWSGTVEGFQYSLGRAFGYRIILTRTSHQSKTADGLHNYQMRKTYAERRSRER